MKLEYMGGDRPWYMTRKGRRRMQESLVTTAAAAPSDPLRVPTPANNPEDSHAMVTSPSP